MRLCMEHCPDLVLSHLLQRFSGLVLVDEPTMRASCTARVGAMSIGGGFVCFVFIIATCCHYSKNAPTLLKQTPK